jgi:peptide/nickel transport system permease protein
MLPWLARRLLHSALVVLGAASAAFLGMDLLPGDPVRVILGGTTPTAAMLAQVRRQLGFDEPLAVRYAQFIGRLVRGNLGVSYQLREPVTTVIGARIAPTAELAGAALVLALVLAGALAVSTAGRRPLARRAASAAELLMISSPSFWIGVLLLTVFSFRWHLFPAAGGGGLAGLVLPAVTLSLSLAGVFAQVLRAAMERALEEPFILTARARGSGDTQVRLRHALRHALIPLITLSGWSLGALLSGTVIVETIFARPGLGRALETAVSGRDIPVVTGIVVLSAIAFTLINIGVDLLYRVADPRLAGAAR